CGNSTTCVQHINSGAGEICGKKFFDMNANGVQDPGEPGVPGWTITLTNTNGDPPQTTQTDQNGDYCFLHIFSGTYIVSEESRANWFATTPTSVTLNIMVGACQQVANFGNVHYCPPSNGHTLGFWHNKNGRDVLCMNDPGWRTLLGTLNGTTYVP